MQKCEENRLKGVRRKWGKKNPTPRAEKWKDERREVVSRTNESESESLLLSTSVSEWKQGRRRGEEREGRGGERRTRGEDRQTRLNWRLSKCESKWKWAFFCRCIIKATGHESVSVEWFSLFWNVSAQIPFFYSTLLYRKTSRASLSSLASGSAIREDRENATRGRRVREITGVD